MSGPTTKNTKSISLGILDIRVGDADAYISSTTPVLPKSASLGSIVETSFTSTVEFYEHQQGFPASIDLTIPISEDASISFNYEENTPFNFALARGLNPYLAGTDWTPTGISSVTDAGTYDDSLVLTAGPEVYVDSMIVLFDTATTFTVISGKFGELTGVGDTTASSPFSDDNGIVFTFPADYFTGTWAIGDTFSFTLTKEGYDNISNAQIGLGNLKTPEYLRCEGIYTYPDGTTAQAFIFPRAQVKSPVEMAFSNDTAIAVPMTFTATPSGDSTEGGNAAWNDMPLGLIAWQPAS